MLYQYPRGLCAVLSNQCIAWPALACDDLLQPCGVIAIDRCDACPIFRLSAGSNRGATDLLVLFYTHQQFLSQRLIQKSILLRTKTLCLRQQRWPRLGLAQSIESGTIFITQVFNSDTTVRNLRIEITQRFIGAASCRKTFHLQQLRILWKRDGSALQRA